MRTMEINKTQMWYINAIGENDILDENGDYTGEKEMIYSSPKPIKLHVYPATGDILEESFGIVEDLDFVTTTNIKLESNTLLFLSNPIVSGINKYDYKIIKILPSLNSYQYGLSGVR